MSKFTWFVLVNENGKKKARLRNQYLKNPAKHVTKVAVETAPGVNVAPGIYVITNVVHQGPQGGVRMPSYYYGPDGIRFYF